MLAALEQVEIHALRVVRYSVSSALVLCKRDKALRRIFSFWSECFSILAVVVLSNTDIRSLVCILVTDNMMESVFRFSLLERW